MYMVGWRLGFVLTREWTQRFKGPRSSIFFPVSVFGILYVRMAGVGADFAFAWQ
jgi:hypothetical protein